MHKETCLPVHKLCIWQAILWWHYDKRHFCKEIHSTLLQSVVPLISSIFFIELRSNFSMELFCWTCDQCTGFPFSDEIVLITVFLIITLSHLNFPRFLFQFHPLMQAGITIDGFLLGLTASSLTTWGSLTKGQ